MYWDGWIHLFARLLWLCVFAHLVDAVFACKSAAYLHKERVEDMRERASAERHIDVLADLNCLWLFLATKRP